MLAGIDAWANRFGSQVGSMQVTVTGTCSDGSTVKRIWDLTARQNHGPEIPCVPATALAKKLLRGEIARRGAMPCVGLVDLDDIAAELEGLDIDWQVREAVDE